VPGHALNGHSWEKQETALLDFVGHPGQAGKRHSAPENDPQSGSENGRAG
jgi:hypothetical protein